MALNVTTLPRVFQYGSLNLTDPDRSLSPEEVMSFYSNTYPALTTSNGFGPEIKNDKCVYEFKTSVGTKG